MGRLDPRRGRRRFRSRRYEMSHDTRSPSAVPPLRIRNLVIDPPILPAPMCGISDRAWRLLAREQGCALTYTQMASSDALNYHDQKTWDILDVAGEDKEGLVCIQLLGHRAESLARAARLLEDAGASIVDLNMGCPARKVVASLGGSALLRSPDTVREILRAMRAAVRGPLTIKIRAGWDKYGEDAFAVGKIAEDEGIDAIAIHARTREQGYKGHADWSIIRALKERLRLPVIGNGDITEPEHALEMIRETGCDGVMIGRGILGNPWLLGRAVALLRGETVPPPPTPRERIEMMRRHARLMVERRGEARAIKEFRKHAVQYLRGLPGSHIVKTALMSTLTLAALEEQLDLAADRAEQFARGDTSLDPDSAATCDPSHDSSRDSDEDSCNG